jgi:hypothetical protein
VRGWVENESELLRSVLTGIHRILRGAHDICVQPPSMLMLPGIPLGVDLTFLAERSALST